MAQEEKNLGFTMARTFFTMKALMRRTLLDSGLDLTPEQAALLRHLAENQGSNQREMAANMFKDVAAITRLVDALEKKDLVRRGPDPNDRRSHRLSLTEEGQDMAVKVHELHVSLKKELVSCFDPTELEILIVLLDRLREHADQIFSTKNPV